MGLQSICSYCWQNESWPYTKMVWWQFNARGTTVAHLSCIEVNSQLTGPSWPSVSPFESAIKTEDLTYVRKYLGHKLALVSPLLFSLNNNITKRCGISTPPLPIEQQHHYTIMAFLHQLKYNVGNNLFLFLPNTMILPIIETCKVTISIRFTTFASQKSQSLLLYLRRFFHSCHWASAVRIGSWGLTVWTATKS